jgi:hypothetical protein
MGPAGDYYRIVIENGKIKALFFDKGNPNPHTKLCGKIESPEIFELLCLLYQKSVSPKNSINEFKKIVEGYNKSIREDFEFFFNKKNGKKHITEGSGKQKRI